MTEPPIDALRDPFYKAERETLKVCMCIVLVQSTPFLYIFRLFCMCLYLLLLMFLMLMCLIDLANKLQRLVSGHSFGQI